MAPFVPAAKGCKVAAPAVFLPKAAANGIAVGVCKKPGRKRGSTEIHFFVNKFVRKQAKEAYRYELLVGESDRRLLI